MTTRKTTAIPNWLLPPAYSLTLTALLLGATIGALRNWPGANGLDLGVHSWVVRHRAEWPTVTAALRTLTRFGNPPVAVAATLAVTLGLYVSARRGVATLRPSDSMAWLGTILAGRYLCLGLKELVRRPRPPTSDWLVVETSYSFPSTHSEFAAVFFAMLALDVVRGLPGDRAGLKVAALLACASLAALVGLSRVWLGVHYPTDVVGGLILGTGWAFTVATLHRGWARRRAATAENA